MQDPFKYGQRLPLRRAQLAVGTSLTIWVLVQEYRDNGGFQESFVVDNVKNFLETADTGLQWPEGNATILDEALNTYGDCLKIQFLINCLALVLLLCSCWCDWAARDRTGLKASRSFGFAGLSLLFFASLVPAAPNYLRITRMDTLCPCCAQQFNFLVKTVLQDMVGIVCSGLFAFKLLPVLLVVVPSLVRACSMILEADIHSVSLRTKKMKETPFKDSINTGDSESPHLQLQLQDEAVQAYSDPSFSRSNVHSVLAISSMLTPVFTAIPLTVLLQLLRRPQYTGPEYNFNYWWCPWDLSNFAFISINMFVFYVGPICLGFVRCKTFKGVFWRYLCWMLLYVGPLFVMLIHESIIFGFWNDVKGQLLDPRLWEELVCEICIANVILSDIMYSNLHIERRTAVDAVSQRSHPCTRMWTAVKVAVVPIGFTIGSILAVMDKLDISLLHGMRHNNDHYGITRADNGHPCPWERTP
jgi:hypothetical protein